MEFLPPPNISLCSSSNEGSLRIRAEMSVQRPIAQRGDMPLVSPKGVMSRQAISCSISVKLARYWTVNVNAILSSDTNNPKIVSSDWPYLFEFLGVDFQVVQNSPHSYHYLTAIAGSNTDVLPIWLFPFAHQGLWLLSDKPDWGWCYLKGQMSIGISSQPEG